MKAKSQIYFGFALLGILLTFAGIYTSLLLGTGFSSAYLEDYIKSYVLGGAIVLIINWTVFPISSEKELRRTLVMSLGHIKTFVQYGFHVIINALMVLNAYFYVSLIGKSYTQIITEEERAVRDALAQSIRADFGILQMKLGTTMLEINWSKFSMSDYRKMIATTQKLQQVSTMCFSAMNFDRSVTWSSRPNLGSHWYV